jgi:hypothetical protein
VPRRAHWRERGRGGRWRAQRLTESSKSDEREPTTATRLEAETGKYVSWNLLPNGPYYRTRALFE